MRRPVTMPLWGLVLTVLVALVLGGAAGGGSSTDDEPAARASDVTVATTSTTLSVEQLAARASAEKVVADRLAAEKAAADKAAADAVAAAAAARAPRTISGRGSKITDRFPTVTGNYKLTWQASGGKDNFIVRLHSASGTGSEGMVNEIPPEPSSGETLFRSSGGDYYFEVDASDLSWTITISPV